MGSVLDGKDLFLSVFSNDCLRKTHALELVSK